MHVVLAMVIQTTVFNLAIATEIFYSTPLHGSWHSTRQSFEVVTSQPFDLEDVSFSTSVL